jgi:hypothetical protein
MAQRVGFYSLKKVAREMCRLIFFFTPVIKAVYPSATALHAALSAANAACEVLYENIVEVEPQGV